MMEGISMAEPAPTIMVGTGVMVLGVYTGLNPDYLVAAFFGAITSQAWSEAMPIVRRILVILFAISAGTYLAPIAAIVLHSEVDSVGVDLLAPSAAFVISFSGHQVLGPGLLKSGKFWFRRGSKND